jgi:hypothetical protein
MFCKVTQLIGLKSGQTDPKAYAFNIEQMTGI